MSKKKFNKVERQFKRADGVTRGNPNLIDYKNKEAINSVQEYTLALEDEMQFFLHTFLNHSPELFQSLDLMDNYAANIMSGLSDMGIYDYNADWQQKEQENLKSLREQGRI